MQFRAQELEVTPPSSKEGIERYLASGMIRGVGPELAKRLVRAFGDSVFDIERTIDGIVSYSQTDEFDVISAITLNVDLKDGQSSSRSASVLSQTSITNPWLGVIDGELPDLSSN